MSVLLSKEVTGSRDLMVVSQGMKQEDLDSKVDQVLHLGRTGEHLVIHLDQKGMGINETAFRLVTLDPTIK